MITISVFLSGSVIITGANHIDQIKDAYKFINKVLKDNYSKLKRICINSEEQKSTLMEAQKRLSSILMYVVSNIIIFVSYISVAVIGYRYNYIKNLNALISKSILKKKKIYYIKKTDIINNPFIDDTKNVEKPKINSNSSLKQNPSPNLKQNPSPNLKQNPSPKVIESY